MKNKRDLLCEATIKGICSHFGVTYKVGGTAPASKPVSTSPTGASVPSTSKPWKNGTYSTKMKVVNCTSLNVRAGRPGSGKYNTIITALARNTEIEVGYCLNGWFGVIVNGKQGFISGDYLQLV